MKNPKANNSENSDKIGKVFSTTKGGYIKKMEDGYYKAFLEDGTELTEVTLPINICLMALRGKLPAGVTVCPSEEDIEMEPSLKVLRDNYLNRSPF